MASFAKLLRNSKFIQLGDFQTKLLTGKIVHRVEENFYVDIGLKFNAVCKAPTNRNSKDIYAIGSNVIVQLYDPELSERFLGSRYDLTLLEADAKILKLLKE